MWIGTLAITGVGIPDLSASPASIRRMPSSKRPAARHGVGRFAFWLGIAAALMTSFYSWRLMFLTFYGKPRADHHTLEHAHEAPWVMLIPLVVLAIGAVFAGFVVLRPVRRRRGGRRVLEGRQFTYAPSTST